MGQAYGSLINMKIENMREQHIAIVGEKEKKVEQHPYAIVTVAMGSGVADLLRSIGASYVIEGGQTMNPSTEDIVKAIEQIGAERVIIVPNNKNIVMAAKQAAEVIDIEAAVVETKSIPEGITAILSFNPEASVSENVEWMTDAAAEVKTGQVTTAVRDTEIDGVTIKKDEFMGISGGKIVVSTPSLEETAQTVARQMIDEDEDEIVTLIYGDTVTEAEAESFASFIEETYPDLDVETHNGKQPLYPYIISVE